MTGKYRFSLLRLTLLAIAMLALAGCRQQAGPATLRIAVLPILDTLPMYVAQANDYFAEEDLTVTFIPVASAPERDQLVQAGEADGMVNELLSTMFYNVNEVEAVTVSYARKATPQYPHFYILASGESGIVTLEDLRGQPIGISEGTIIEYSTERLLQAEGYSDEDINTVAVPRLPDRLALLNAGELTAANLPDPLASMALLGGAVNVIDDSVHPEFGHSVITFRQEVVDESPQAISAFLRAIDRAVADINADKNRFDALLAERQLLPEPLQGNFKLPDYPAPAVPPESQWEDVQAWALAKGYLATDVPYDGSVSDAFLP